MTDWYTLQVHGQEHAARLTPDEAAALQEQGLEPEPAEAPADLAGRIGRMLATLCEISPDPAAAGSSGGDRDEV